VAEISSSTERFRRCQCVCHRCYIYLGDLARYKELHLVVEGRTADWYVAANYYRQASALWPSGGNPHNQVLVPTIIILWAVLLICVS
jgi:protein SMG7